jgi:hypothetical protein
MLLQSKSLLHLVYLLTEFINMLTYCAFTMLAAVNSRGQRQQSWLQQACARECA